MSVTFKHPEYNENHSKWKLIWDVLNSNVKEYIKDVDKNDKVRNCEYKDGAQLNNFTLKTKLGLIGELFRRDPECELPENLEYLKESGDDFDSSIYHIAKNCVGEALSVGRYGLLVDFPPVEGGLTEEEAQNPELYARIYEYTADNITSWHVENFQGKAKLTLVVLQEPGYKLQDDGFTLEQTVQYRVLRLIDGIYSQSVYDSDENHVSTYIPTDATGNSWNEIPFTFVGSEGISPKVNPMPLLDLAQLNIGHLQNSADFEESVYVCGQPILVFTSDQSKEEFAASNPNGIKIGARAGINLGIDGSCQLLQASPNQLADVAMKRKEEQAIMLGARLINKEADRETAESVRKRNTEETSVLLSVALNVELALERSCKYVLRFMSENYESLQQEISIKLDKQFFDKAVDANLLMAKLQLYEKGLLSREEVVKDLKLNTNSEDYLKDYIDEPVETLPEYGNQPEPTNKL